MTLGKKLSEKIPCPEYREFNRILADELNLEIDADRIINKPDFFEKIWIDYEDHEILTRSERFTRLKGRMGLYILWVDADTVCEQHGKVTHLAAYVGKGFGEVRVNSHIKEKWPNDEPFHVSFYECSNRVAKYLEQLFLDLYHFHLNTMENKGEAYLYSHWDEFLVIEGTEAKFLAEEFQDRIDSTLQNQGVIK